MGTHTHYYTSSKTLKYFWYRPCVPWNFPIHIKPCFCFAFHTPAHYNALISNFLGQISHVSCSITSKLLKNYVSTHLIQFQYCCESDKLQIIIQAHLTPFATHWLATPFFQVFCDPFSGNDIGLHTIGILIIPQFIVLNSGKK